MIKAIVFDFFGVLCPDIYWEWHKKNVEDNEENRQYAKNFLKKVGTGAKSYQEDLPDVARKFGVPVEEINAGIKREIRIDKELAELIGSLKRNYKIGLLSNSPSDVLNEILDDYDLQRLFDVKVISSEVGLVKPQPEIFERAVEMLQVQGEDIVFIDDRQENVDVANRLGIKGLLYQGVEDLKGKLNAFGVTW